MDFGKDRQGCPTREAPPVIPLMMKQCSYGGGCTRNIVPPNKGLIIPTPLNEDPTTKITADHLKKYNPLRYKYFQTRSAPRGQFVKIKCYTYYVNHEGAFLGPFRGKDQKKSKVTLRPWDETYGSVDESIDPYFNQHQLNAASSLADTPHTGLSRSSSRMIIKTPSLFVHKKLLFEEAPFVSRESVAGLCRRQSYSMYSWNNFYSEYKFQYICLFFMPDDAPEYLSMYRDLGFNIIRKLKMKNDNIKDYTVCICFWERKKMKSYYSNLLNFLLHQEYIVFLPSSFMENEWVHTRQSPKDMAHIRWINKTFPKLGRMSGKRNGLQQDDIAGDIELRKKSCGDNEVKRSRRRRSSEEALKGPLWCRRESAKSGSDPPPLPHGRPFCCFNVKTKRACHEAQHQPVNPISKCNLLFN